MTWGGDGVCAKLNVEWSTCKLSLVYFEFIVYIRRQFLAAFSSFSFFKRTPSILFLYLRMYQIWRFSTLIVVSVIRINISMLTNPSNQSFLMSFAMGNLTGHLHLWHNGHQARFKSVRLEVRFPAELMFEL